MESNERILKFQSTLSFVQSSFSSTMSFGKYAVTGYFSYKIIHEISGKDTHFAFITNLPALIGIDPTNWIGYFLAILFCLLYFWERKLRKDEIQKKRKAQF